MAVSNEPPAWVLALDPSPDWAHNNMRRGDGWSVEARWWGVGDEPATEGPREVVIRMTDDAPASVRQRGVNSGVLRHAERLVGEMVREWRGDGASGGAKQLEDAVRPVVATGVNDLLQMGGPRGGGDKYYARLLSLFETLVNFGYGEPVNLIAEFMNTPKETVRTQLRKARVLHHNHNKNGGNQLG